MEPLDILPVLHFIFIVEGEEGLGIGVSRIPELEGQPNLAWELLHRSHKRPLRKVRPPARRLHCVTVWRRESSRPI
jgi:hypothetical protein